MWRGGGGGWDGEGKSGGVHEECSGRDGGSRPPPADLASLLPSRPAPLAQVRRRDPGSKRVVAEECRYDTTGEGACACLFAGVFCLGR